jgi:hypothetical protein
MVIVLCIKRYRLNDPSFSIYKVLGLGVGSAGGFSTTALSPLSGLGENSLLGVVHFVELVVVHVGALDDLDLSDLDVLDGVDGRHLLGDLFLNGLAGEEVEELSDVGLGDLLGDDIIDALADNLLLGRQSVVGLALLTGRLSGEGDHEDAEDIAVLGLDVSDGLNKGLSLLDERADLILGGVDAVEAGDGLSAFGLVDDESNLPPVEAVLVGSKVGLHGLNNSSLNAVFDFF